MYKRILGWVFGATLIGVSLIGCGQKDNAGAPAEKPLAEAQDLVKEHEAKEIGIEAYEYAYPLVTMELTRRVSTNVAAPEGSRAPMGQFAKLRGYPAIDDHTVTAPNADTLYTILWLDVSKEPWIVSAPDMNGRFYLLPILDGWTTVFADPGKRTTGTSAQKFAITGPGWSGTLPAGVTEYKSATEYHVAARPNLLHRYTRGLQGGTRIAGSNDRGTVVRLRHCLHSAWRHGRSQCGYENRHS